ncbi:MAG TPA: ABC transporter substrate-binding protein [Baekduia sp.]|uniref:ABC transporter substrate-binding protein n=1 Tax=Baekduia sp. TaxID=2600305 RepID=UPI002C7A0B89|nr:ABC transporter substrate-binding protein [Baekduia sp.]HMJ34452.1 ABC transporter substrate-binding protein [Baekduia sp.]
MRRTTPIRAALVLAAGAVSVALAACGGGASGGTATASTTPVKGGTVVYGADREPTCLDPHNSGDMPQTYVSRQYLDSLVSELPGGRIVPWLATSWKVSADGLTYTFTLKQGVKFTDGEPLTAAAVKANFEQILDPKTQSSTDLIYLKPYYKSSEAVDAHTLRVTLKKPYSPLLTVLAQAFLGIESPKAMARGLKANCESPVGTGPFIVKQWIHGQRVELVRNPDYNSPPANAKHQGPAYLDGITWRFLKDNSVRFSALKSGEAHLIFNIPPEHQPAAEADPSLELQSFNHSGNPNGFGLNVDRAPFNDLKVRQALLYASNAKEAVKSAYLGVFPYAGAPLGSGTPFYDKSLEDAYPHDPAKAGALLDAAGWTGRNGDGYRTKDGQELAARFVYSSDPGDTPPADVTLYQDIQAAAKEVGFHIKLVPQAQTTFFATFQNPKAYEAVNSYWNSPTPGVLYIVFSTESKETGGFNNASQVSNPALDKILLDAAASNDEAQQRTLYTQAQSIISKNAWQLTLYPVQTRLAISKKLKDVWIEPSEGEPVLHDAYLAR